MKFAFSLLLMSTTLGAGSEAFAAGQGITLTPATVVTSLHVGTAPSSALTLIDDDGAERDDEGEGGWFWSQSEDDDEDEDEDEDDDDCDEGDDGDDCAAGSAGNAAKAGTVPPPQNGLFTNGAAPVVKSN